MIDESNINKLVARTLMREMHKSGLSVNALANRAGLPPTTLYALYNGKCNNIGIRTLYLAVRYGLDISLTEFFKRIDLSKRWEDC